MNDTLYANYLFLYHNVTAKVWIERKNKINKQIPAVTIVAAWIRAETGVGPAIASGNQTYKGNL